MNTVTTRRPGIIGFGIATLIIVATLLSLGFWQLQRRGEKHALIAALDARITEAPVALPSSDRWSTMSAASDEFRRVTFTATYKALPDAMVYSSGSGVRPDVPGAVTWAFLPAALPNGATVVINAGFVQNTMQDRAQQDRVVKTLLTGASVTMTGYLRYPETAGTLTPHDDVAKRLWFNRDQRAMASALGWGAVAPFYVDLETPVPANGIPKPGPLVVRLKDDHMQYAITWFSLAAAVVIAFGVWTRGQKRS
ncbi:SURF1 family protein [Tardiphaga sp.]|jgi:surfeit locus 1 family protein|uniref:SURF1 family protein n=1 Tax=Tardiphaga sp. TaxID=1926292 RepID=UPI0037DA1F86